MIANLVSVGLIIGAVTLILGSRQMIMTGRRLAESADTLGRAAKNVGLSSQRLIAETALIDGLIRDLAHGHGLHYPEDSD